MNGTWNAVTVSRSASHDQLPDQGLYGPGSVTWRIHGDPAMALAGFRSLLLQAVHPLVMAGLRRQLGLPRTTRGAACSARGSGSPP